MQRKGQKNEKDSIGLVRRNSRCTYTLDDIGLMDDHSIRSRAQSEKWSAGSVEGALTYGPFNFPKEYWPYCERKGGM
jgi:hypothetical protein